jgi:hypothetical protein
VRRHELDLTSLIAGLVFVGVAVAYLVGTYTDTRIGAGWLLPIALIGLGLAGLAGAVRRGLRPPPEE